MTDPPPPKKTAASAEADPYAAVYAYEAALCHALEGNTAAAAGLLGTHFTRFTGTKVQILTQMTLLERVPVYKITNTDESTNTD